MATKVEQEAPAVSPARLYTYEEISGLAGVSPRQVRRWVESGWLGYVQLPQGRRISGELYLAFIARRSVAADA